MPNRLLFLLSLFATTNNYGSFKDAVNWICLGIASKIEGASNNVVEKVWYSWHNNAVEGIEKNVTVFAEHGLVPISQLRIGDKVWTATPTGGVVLRRILEIKTHDVNHIYCFAFNKDTPEEEVVACGRYQQFFEVRPENWSDDPYEVKIESKPQSENVGGKPLWKKIYDMGSDSKFSTFVGTFLKIGAVLVYGFDFIKKKLQFYCQPNHRNSEKPVTAVYEQGAK